MSAPRKIEIEGTANGFRVRVINAVTPNQWEYYPSSAVKSVVGVSAIGMGTRQSDNNRKNPIQYDDKLDFVISFIDENNCSPVRYNIQDVDNQATWTPDAAGLAIALSDINGWLGVGSGTGGAASLTAIEASLTDVTRTPHLFRTDGSGTAGSIATTCYSASIYNAGSEDGEVMGITIKPGETFNFDAGGNGNMYTAATITWDDLSATELVITWTT